MMSIEPAASCAVIPEKPYSLCSSSCLPQFHVSVPMATKHTTVFGL